MNDRELLEMAARAIGLDLCFNDAGTPGYYSEWRGMPQWEVWNPLVHDGHALRLAVKIGFDELCWFHKGQEPGVTVNDLSVCIHEKYDGDPCAATRRAIVRAAVEIGKTMP